MAFRSVLQRKKIQRALGNGAIAKAVIKESESKGKPAASIGPKPKPAPRTDIIAPSRID